MGGIHFSCVYLYGVMLLLSVIISLHFWFRDLIREFYKKYEVLLMVLFLAYLIFIHVTIRSSEVHLYYNLQVFYWHFLESLWLFIFLVYGSNRSLNNYYLQLQEPHLSFIY